MREIKFRAWDKSEEKMVQVRKIDFELGQIMAGIFKGNFGWDDGTDAYELMQFTGLKDKQGKEVFEGDIIADRENPEYKYVVEWCDTDGGFVLKDFPEYEYSFGEEVTQGEIVGNIHENPELLPPINN